MSLTYSYSLKHIEYSYNSWFSVLAYSCYLHVTLELVSTDWFFFSLWFTFLKIFWLDARHCILRCWVVDIFVFLYFWALFWNAAKLLVNLRDNFLLRLAFKVRAAFHWVLIFTHYWGNTAFWVYHQCSMLCKVFSFWLMGTWTIPPLFESWGFSACSFLVVLSPVLDHFLKCVHWSELSWRCKGTLCSSRFWELFSDF